MNEPHFIVLNNPTETFQDIQWLTDKLAYIKDKVLKLYQEDLKLIQQIMTEEHKKKLYDPKLIDFSKIPKNLPLQTTLKLEIGSTKFIYEFDTFMCDIKRCVDFTFKFVMASTDHNPKDFSLQNLINHLNNNSKNEKSVFAKFLIEKNPEIVQVILNEWGQWLKIVETYRTYAQHTTIKQDYYCDIKIDYNIQGDSINNMTSNSTGILYYNKPIDTYCKEIYEYATKFIKQLLIFANAKAKSGGTLIQINSIQNN